MYSIAYWEVSKRHTQCYSGKFKKCIKGSLYTTIGSFKKKDILYATVGSLTKEKRHTTYYKEVSIFRYKFSKNHISTTKAATNFYPVPKFASGCDLSVAICTYVVAAIAAFVQGVACVCIISLFIQIYTTTTFDYAAA